ncbi:MAG: tRNA (N6-threonylcarbamoyladenosine(37)-N6)-methyltransferase TrmO [Thiotrichales bacterium]
MDLPPVAATPMLIPVGVVHSPFKEKFGIPRQPGLISAVPGTIELLPPYNQPDAVRGLEAFSHIWVLFLMHAIPAEQTGLTARPPRLGGNTRVGVFASRSTHRPNRIGQSVVRLEAVEAAGSEILLRISGHDLLDATPVLDIKPYLPYADAIGGAIGGYADDAPAECLTIAWSNAAATQIDAARISVGWDLRALIEAMLRLDPRPAYRAERDSARLYGMRVDRYDVRFEIRGTCAHILDVVPYPV